MGYSENGAARRLKLCSIQIEEKKTKKGRKNEKKMEELCTQLHVWVLGDLALINAVSRDPMEIEGGDH